MVDEGSKKCVTSNEAVIMGTPLGNAHEVGIDLPLVGEVCPQGPRENNPTHHEPITQPPQTQPNQNTTTETTKPMKHPHPLQPPLPVSELTSKRWFGHATHLVVASPFLRFNSLLHTTTRFAWCEPSVCTQQAAEFFGLCAATRREGGSTFSSSGATKHLHVTYWV